MYNKKNLKILFAEDVSTDFELAERILKKADITFESICVQTKENFIRALDEFKPDIVISDYAMPTFDGMTALKLVQNLTPKVPFIILTGSMDEETAVACMKQGANDYVIKELISRLPYAVKEAITNKQILIEKEKAEKENLELSERLRHYLATSQTITYALRIEQNIFLPFWVSENVTRILGYETHEVIQEDWWINNLHVNDRDTAIQKIDELRASGDDTLIHEYRFFTKAKRIVWIRDELRLLKDNNGNPYEIVGTWTDVSQRKKAEEELLKSEQRYRQFFEEDLSGVYLSTVTGTLLDCNPAYVNIFGYKNKEEALKTNILSVFEDPKHRDIFINLINERKTIVYYEQKYFKKNKEIIYVIENAIGIFGDDGKLEKIQGYIFDITEIKILQNELIKAKESAEKASRLKSEFLAQISHEIRTPINAIISSASLLKEETLKYLHNEENEYFTIINSAGKRIIRTIDSILNMSELQIGSYEPKFTTVSIFSEIIETLYKEFIHQANFKNIKLEKIKATENDVVLADWYSVEQIFANLIDNAIKYTENGSVEIIVYRNTQNILCVDVKDTGMGIAEEYLPELFTAFSQEHQGYSRKFEGNGLGLALVENYCKINNAEIKVESKKGEGSVFTVIFDEKVN